jgi:RNA polymerase sigma-70 factor (ECF subfamily)
VISDEQQLVERARKGDLAAFSAIFRRHHPSVYAYLFYRVGSVPLAEDLAGEVFVRLVKHIQTFSTEPGRPILAWLYTIAGHLVIDHYRQNGRGASEPLDETLADALLPDLTDQATASLAVADLAKAMRRLTEEQQQVILLKFMEGKSNAEVAALLGKNEGAIKSLQHRALQALRRILEREYGYETTPL